MIYWIFDLDDTIYQLSGRFSYHKLKPDQELKTNISKLSGMKVLFTNGTHEHTQCVLKAMNLDSVFDFILDRDIVGVDNMKPDPKAFQILINLCSIKENDLCYYFEDSINNLAVGYSLGWKTILIGTNYLKLTNKENFQLIVLVKINNQLQHKTITINYHFNNIHQAITNF